MKYLFSNSFFGKSFIAACLICSCAQHSSALVWTPMNVGTTYPLKNIYFVNDTVGYIIDEYGFVHKTGNGGTTWTLASAGATAGVNLYFLSKDTGLVIGQGIFRTVNAGASWDTIRPYTPGTWPYNDYIISLSFPGNGSTGYVSAYSGGFDSVVVYKTTDRGNSWTVCRLSAPLIPFHIYFLQTLIPATWETATATFTKQSSRRFMDTAVHHSFSIRNIRPKFSCKRFGLRRCRCWHYY